MIRGSSKFQKLFGDANNGVHRKGRSEHLYTQRNELLIDRFYFYGELSGKRFDIIISTLSKEFFLSPLTVAKLVDNNYDLLKMSKLKFRGLQEGQVIEQLKKKWSHIAWDTKQI